MAGLKLYYDLMSQPSRALYVLLAHYKIPFQPIFTNIAKGENKTEEFKKISKFQQLPAIEDNGFAMIERGGSSGSAAELQNVEILNARDAYINIDRTQLCSTTGGAAFGLLQEFVATIAILRYIARTQNLPNSFYPQEAKEQFKVDEYLEWQHHNIRYFLGTYFILKFLVPNRFKKPVDEQAVTNAKKGMIKCLDSFEGVWLAQGPFITGKEITAADLWAACEIEQPRICGFDPREGRPTLAAWITKVQEHFNPTYDKAHAAVYKIEQMSKK